MFLKVLIGQGRRRIQAAIYVLAMALPMATSAGEIPPPGLTIAFYGDQGVGPGAEAVLRLVKREGVHAVAHLGDFDYRSNPAAWEAQTDSLLGKDMPLFAVVGNHDLFAWNGPMGYAARIQARMVRLGIPFDGTAGVKFSFHFKGIFFILTAPGLIGTGHAEYIRKELERDTSAWSVSGWHMNQAAMQVGTKPDEVGWDVYEESRIGGAIIATAHEHSYSRTHLLSRFRSPVVHSRDSVLAIRPGRTFAFVNGLGGDDIRLQSRGGDWWASIYTRSQGAKPGALFATFHVDGDPRKALFTFKTVDGEVIDRFTAFSEAIKSVKPGIRSPPSRPRTLEFNPESLGIPPGGSLRLDDLNGRSAGRRENLRGPVSMEIRNPGLVFLRGGDGELSFLKTLIVLP